MKTIFMWGAGNVCRHFLQHLKKDLPVQGIVDRDPTLSCDTICGIPIYAPIEAGVADRLKIGRDGGEYICPPPRDTVFIITTYVYYISVKDYLESLGYETAFVYDLREYTDVDWSSLCRIHYDVPGAEDDCAEIQEARSILADERSAAVFDALLEKRRERVYDCTDIRSEYPQYLEMDLVPFCREETIVDCGAFRGDGLRIFKERLHSWKMFHCFEPDADNFRILQENCRKYERTEPHCAAVGDYDGQAYFSQGANAGGELQQGGAAGQRIEVCRLDSLALSEVTYITADIEGSEMAMLEGARRTIERHCPKLAVCVYHKAADLWEIPLWLKAANPAYRIFLRHYGETAVDTVAYALPPTGEEL